MKSVEAFRSEMRENGYCLFESVLPTTLTSRMRQDIERHCRRCEQTQRDNGFAIVTAGAAHHAIGAGDSLDEFLAHDYLDKYISAYFDGAAHILNSYGAVMNLPVGEKRYEHGHAFHRDVRTYAGEFHLMLNMLVMVDAFTADNGATRVIPGSHLQPGRPSDEALLRDSMQCIGPEGSIVLFDSNLWHSAAPNHTSRARLALTPTFTRAFVKQQLDYPRYLGEDYPKDDRLRQLLGYRARVPGNLQEWYQPPESRFYHRDQG